MVLQQVTNLPSVRIWEFDSLTLRNFNMEESALGTPNGFETRGSERSEVFESLFFRQINIMQYEYLLSMNRCMSPSNGEIG